MKKLIKQVVAILMVSFILVSCGLSGDLEDLSLSDSPLISQESTGGGEDGGGVDPDEEPE